MRRDTTLTSAPAAFPELVAAFLAEFFRLNPVHATAAGMHDLDGCQRAQHTA